MQISPVSNTITTSKFNTTSKSYNVTQNPSFSGLWNIFPKKNSLRYVKLDSDMSIFSPNELKKLRKNISSEIQEIISMPETPALKKRLDDLLHSPFTDYKIEYEGESLSDRIAYPYKHGKGTALYRQFITTSLAETMPLEILKGKEFKEIAYREGNEPLHYIFDNYHKMNENTPEAASIRKIVHRFKDADIYIPNQNFYLAESLVKNQPLMSKTYVDLFGIKPFQNMDVYTHLDKYPIECGENLDKHYGNSNFIDHPTLGKFFVVNPYKIDDGYTLYVGPEGSKLISLYQLSQLSKNEEIRKVFDLGKIYK